MYNLEIVFNNAALDLSKTVFSDKINDFCKSY